MREEHILPGAPCLSSPLMSLIKANSNICALPESAISRAALDNTGRREAEEGGEAVGRLTMGRSCVGGTAWTGGKRARDPAGGQEGRRLEKLLQAKERWRDRGTHGLSMIELEEWGEG